MYSHRANICVTQSTELPQTMHGRTSIICSSICLYFTSERHACKTDLVIGESQQVSKVNSNWFLSVIHTNTPRKSDPFEYDWFYWGIKDSV